MSNDSPLHIAVKNNNIDLVKMLLESQCDVHAVNAEGQTPLQLATQTGNTEMVALLLQHGAGRQASLTPPPIASSPSSGGAAQTRGMYAHQRGIASAGSVGAVPSQTQVTIKMLNTYFTWFWICALTSFLIIPAIVATVYGCLLLYQLWKLIPKDIARTTPGKAVGFQFIPFFNFYWFYVAYLGLSKDMNETLRQRGVQMQTSEDWAQATCVLSIVSVVVSLFDPTVIIGILVGIPAAIASIFFFKSVKNGAIALLEQNDQ